MSSWWSPNPNSQIHPSKSTPNCSASGNRSTTSTQHTARTGYHDSQGEKGRPMHRPCSSFRPSTSFLACVDLGCHIVLHGLKRVGDILTHVQSADMYIMYVSLKNTAVSPQWWKGTGSCMSRRAHTGRVLHQSMCVHTQKNDGTACVRAITNKVRKSWELYVVVVGIHLKLSKR